MKDIYHLIRRIIKGVMGKDVLIFPDCKKIKYEMLGSDYGGWPAVREVLERDSIVYSVGVGDDISYDLALIDNCSVNIHAFDPTPRSCEWIRKQILPGQLHFYNYGLSDYDGEQEFIAPEIDVHMSYSTVKSGTGILLTVKKLSTIMTELRHDTIDLLKMDIEGGEYKVIDNLLNENITPKILLIEFHHRFPEVGLDKTKKSIKLLKARGYCIFFVSPNGEEYGFYLNK
jgi:FkbM family methyltransferase